jgi:hypothetical protein
MKKAIIETWRGECLIDRISDKGARIRLAAADEIPLEFYIRIEGENGPRCCAIARRGRGQLSVYFV